MAKNLIRVSFWPICPKFGSPLLHVRHCCKLSLYVISSKINKPNSRKWQKDLVSGLTLASWTQIWVTKFFSNTQLHQSLDSIVSCHHAQYQKKTNDSVLIRASDGRTDGQTDRWCYLTNVEHPIIRNVLINKINIGILKHLWNSELEGLHATFSLIGHLVSLWYYEVSEVRSKDIKLI